MAVAAKRVVIEVEGMPGGIEFKKPSRYGMDQLSSILEAGPGMKFTISKMQSMLSTMFQCGIVMSWSLRRTTLTCTVPAVT
jgi:hypothetical protein